MSKKRISILFALFFLGFLGVMNYPFVAQLLNDYDQSDVALSHEQAEADLTEAERSRMRKEAENYNQTLAETSSSNLLMPFEDAQTKDEWYMSLLNIKGDGIMAAVEIPKIEIRIPIYHGTTEAVLKKGAGHLEGSSLPVGGRNTHTVISAHRGIPDKRFFTDLDQIRENDVFFIRILGDILAYKVYNVETVTPDQVEPLKIIKGRDLATLITCTPYGVNTHRIYVQGYRIPYEEAQDVMNELSDTRGFLEKYWWMILTIILLMWMLFLLYGFNRKQKENV